MIQFEITITGKTPLICNRFTDEAAQQATSGSRGSSANSDRGTPREQAAERLYLGHDGKTLVIPQPNVMRCIVDGGTFFKTGRSQVTTKQKSLVYACLDIHGAEIPLVHKEVWSVDTRAVCIPATGGRILKHRPIFNDWALSFVCDLDDSIIGARLFRDIVDTAGSRVGLGDFRPGRKGPFGRFLVTSWAQSMLEVSA